MVPQGLHSGRELLHKEGGVTRGPRRVGLAASETSSPFFRVAGLERVAILEVAGESCTERQRVLLILHYGFDLTLTEIAGEMGVTPSAAMHMHARALRELQVALARLGIHAIRDLI
jgi:DNA-directed RNA polymerase specialized sigma24 family protein